MTMTLNELLMEQMAGGMVGQCTRCDHTKIVYIKNYVEFEKQSTV